MVFGSHSKKRPSNLVFGSFYDGHILDMIELGMDKFVPMSDFKVDKISYATKPCLLFSGEDFESKPEYQRLKSLLIDFWRGEKASNVRLQGLEHIIQVTAADGKIFFRSYRVLLKKSGLKTPRVEVKEMGPAFDFTLRRTRLASDDLYKQALRQPKTLKPRKIKNVAHDVFGTKTGRIHMQKQDLGKLQTRKTKALKRTASDGKDKTGDRSKKSKPSSE